MLFDEVKAYPVILLQSAEPLKAVRDLAAAWRGKAEVKVWDALAGVRSYDDWNRGAGKAARTDPLTALTTLSEAAGATILVAIHLHAYLKNAQVIQALLDGVRVWGTGGQRLVIVAPVGTTVLPEISRYVVILDHDLPSEEALASIVEANAKANGVEMPQDEMARVARMGRGLTAFEFTNAIALSIATHSTVRPDDVMAQKAQLVRKNAALEFSRVPWTFADVGGVEKVKAFMRRTARNSLARGVLLLGVPGVGKTMLAKALANEVGLPALQLEFSRVFGSLVGESERKVHAALRVVEAMAPAILIIDEIEKGLAGVQSSHQSDGGTAARVGEAFLTWLNDRPADGVYVVATSNDIGKLPPEFTRAERWDAIFFFDVPTAGERATIARLYAKKYGIPLDPRPDVQGWTGAEIATAYRLAKMLGTDAQEAAAYVVPLTTTMAEGIDALRKWAQGRCIPASLPDTQQRASQGDIAARRVL